MATLLDVVGAHDASELDRARRVIRLKAIERLLTDGPAIYERLARDPAKDGKTLESEFVVKGVVEISQAVHFFIASEHGLTTTPLLRQFMGLPKRMPIRVWVREDGMIVYDTYLRWRSKPEGPTKAYPLEDLDRATVLYIERSAFNA